MFLVTFERVSRAGSTRLLKLISELGFQNSVVKTKDCIKRSLISLVNTFFLSSLSYQNIKFLFYSTRFNTIKCDELAEPITAACARAHNARLHRRQTAGKLN